MSTVFYTRMPAGIAGDVSRKGLSKIEPHTMDAENPVTKYGVPVKMVSGKICPIAENDAATVVYGFSVRPFPTQGERNEALSEGTPPVSHPIDVLVSGYMTVRNNKAVPAKGGAVYVRNDSGTTSTPIGGIEAGDDSSNCVAIAGASFTGSADANGNVEIRYNI